jgi:hypothetical protein
MAKRSKFIVDMQFLFGDTLIKTGAALCNLVVLIALYCGFNMREAVVERPAGFVVIVLAMMLFALLCWQMGRNVRRHATITDVT